MRENTPTRPFTLPHIPLGRFLDCLPRSETRGIVTKRGGAPCRIFYDDQASSAEIAGAVIRAVTSTDESREISPYINRPSERNADGILGAIGWKQVKENHIGRLTADDNWSFLRTVVDSAAVNYKMMRSIIADAMQYRRLIVLLSPCFANAISLMVRWSLGKLLSYGSMLRVW